MAKDYYKTLGVEKNADKGEIKKAFHKLAHQYHPDKNKGDDSKFKEINEAYQTLSDDTKRSQYDQFGADGPQFGGQGGQGFGGGFGGFDFSGFQQQGGNFDMGDLGDIFGEFFGGGGRGREKKGSDLQMSMQLTFKEALFGVEKKVHITRTAECDTCNGSGGKPGTAKKTCTTCKGTGVHRHNEEVIINIPAGIDHGQTVRMSGYGDAISGGKTGDLYIQITVTADKNFRREGANLTTTIHIPLTDALLGTNYKMDTYDGPIEIKIPEGIPHGDILRVRGKGVPTAHRGRGDLLVTVKINFPKSLSKKQKALISELKEEGL